MNTLEDACRKRKRFEKGMMIEMTECCKAAYQRGWDEGHQTGKEISDALDNDIAIVRELVEEQQEIDLRKHWVRYAAGAVHGIVLVAMLDAQRGKDIFAPIGEVGPLICAVADWMLEAEKQRFEKETDSV